MKAPRFQLWRLLAAVTCLAAALGIVRFAISQIDYYGGGLFPSLCILTAIIFTAAGIGMFFQRAGEFMLGTGIVLLRILLLLLGGR
jgi:hypothetical protein